MTSSVLSLFWCWWCHIFCAGQVESIPAGYVHETIVVTGVGMNDTMYQWGCALLQARVHFSLHS
jgi:hypothetical protein